MNNEAERKISLIAYDWKKISSRIRYEREIRSWSQDEVGEKCSVSRQTVAKWEKNQSQPTLSDMLKLCNLFQCDLGYLLCEYDCRTRTVTDVSEITGLSAAAVEKLIHLHEMSEVRSYTEMLSCFIEDGDFEYFLGILEGYLTEYDSINAYFTMSNVQINKQDLSLFAASQALKRILDRILYPYVTNYETTNDKLSKRLYNRLCEKGYDKSFEQFKKENGI